MFGLQAHIDVTTCDIYGIRIFFFVPMLWDSALLSLLVSFINTDFRFSYLLPSGELCIPDDRLIHLKMSTIYSPIKFSSPSVLIAFITLYRRLIPVDNYPSLLSVPSSSDTL